MNNENCALNLVDEIILYYDARSKKHQMTYSDTILDPETNIVRYAIEGVFNDALTLPVKEPADLANCVIQSGSKG